MHVVVVVVGLADITDLSGGGKSYMMLQIFCLPTLVLASALTSQKNRWNCEYLCYISLQNDK